MGRMEQWPGLADRLRARIAELGYKNPSRFADEKRYRVTDLHKWITDTTPCRATLERLADDLEVNVAWLLLGDASGVQKEPPRPRKRVGRVVKCLVAALGLTTTAWGSAQAEPLPTTDNGQRILLIGSRKCRVFPDLSPCAA